MMMAADALSFSELLMLHADRILGTALTCAAGLVTLLGALVVFVPCLSFVGEPRSQVIALAIATGGVLCFAMLELLPAAQSAFQEVVHDLSSHPRAPINGTGLEHGSVGISVSPVVEGYASLVLAGAFAIGVTMAWIVDTLCMYCSVPRQVMRSSNTRLVPTVATVHEHPTNIGSSMAMPRTGSSSASLHQGTMTSSTHLIVPNEQRTWPVSELLYKTTAARAVSLAIRSIPEGMVLCIATVQRKSFGVLFACAVAMLNVSQGIALATQLAETSGVRWRAVLWCILAALALPLGGLLSWAVLLNTDLTPLVVGVFYGVVGGVLVGICVTQILAVCYSYNTSEGHLVAFSVIGGILFVASLRMLLAFLGF